jgi:hypothetical protein
MAITLSPIKIVHHRFLIRVTYHPPVKARVLLWPLAENWLKIQHKVRCEQTHNDRKDFFCSTLVKGRVFFEQERILIRLTVRQNYVIHVFHHTLCRAIHQFQPTVVIRFLEIVYLAEFCESTPVYTDHHKSGWLRAHMLLEVSHVFEFGICHGKGGFWGGSGIY